MASGSVVNGCQGPFGGDIYLLLSYAALKDKACYNRQACLVSVMQRDIPIKIQTHGHDTVDKSGCSSLYHL